jgi:hypothetical protein
MNRIVMSPAASAILRALTGRARVERNRSLLTDACSVDWCSLTNNGERQQLRWRGPGPEAASVVERMCDGLEDAEFSIPGVIVADIVLVDSSRRSLDGSISLTVEALTVTED